MLVLSPLSELFQLHAPGLTMQIVERFAADNYDFAVRDRWTLRSACKLETLFEEDYVCVARKHHLDAALKAISSNAAWRLRCPTFLLALLLSLARIS
jgi:hypothetical protein